MSNQPIDVRVRAVSEGFERVQGDMVNLQRSAGLTSRAVNMLGNEIAGMAGLSGVAAGGLDLLLDGAIRGGLVMGGLAIAFGVVKGAIDEQKRIWEEQATIYEKVADLVGKTGLSFGAAEAQIRGETQATQAATEAKREYAKVMADLEAGQRFAQTFASALPTDKAAVYLKVMGDITHQEEQHAKDVLYSAMMYEKLYEVRQKLLALYKDELENSRQLTNAERERQDMTAGAQAELARTRDLNAAMLAGQRMAAEQKFSDFRIALEQRTQDQIAQIQAQAAAAAKSRLEGMVSSRMQFSQVTPQDLQDAAAGKYKDKVDEPLRQLRTFLNPENPELNSLFAKLPEVWRAKLKEAFANNPGGYVLTVQDLINTAEAGMDPAAWNVAQIVADIKAALAQEASRQQVMAAVMQQLQAEGIDPNSASVQKLLGVDPSAQIASIKQNMERELKNFRASDPILKGIDAEKESLIAAGTKLANHLMAGITNGITDDSSGAFKAMANALSGIFDNRYVMRGGGGSGTGYVP